jgi:hypothetical protein
MSDNVAIQLPPNELTEALIGAVRANRPVFLWGSPGLGKSSIAQRVANTLGFRYFHDCRLTQMEPSEISMYVPDMKNSRVRQIPPVFHHEDCIHSFTPEQLAELRSQVNSNSISRPASTFVLFDELNSASPLMQTAAYQIVLDRRIGEYSFGEFDYIMAAGNKITDRGITFQMPTPLANRFVHLELVPNTEQWIENMFSIPEYSIHPWVLSFIRFQPDELFRFNPKSADKAFATPRSWQFVSDILKVNWGKLSNRTLLALIAGSVGEGAARKFLAFAEESSQLPGVDEVITGKIRKVKFGNNPALSYAFALSLCYRFREMLEEYCRVNGSNSRKNTKNLDDIYSACSTIIEFSMDNFYDELTVMVARKILTTIPEFDIEVEISRIPVWSKFGSRFGSILRKAAVS